MNFCFKELQSKSEISQFWEKKRQYDYSFKNFFSLSIFFFPRVLIQNKSFHISKRCFNFFVNRKRFISN